MCYCHHVRKYSALFAHPIFWIAVLLILKFLLDYFGRDNVMDGNLLSLIYRLQKALRELQLLYFLLVDLLTFLVLG